MDLKEIAINLPEEESHKLYEDATSYANKISKNENEHVIAYGAYIIGYLKCLENRNEIKH